MSANYQGLQKLDKRRDVLSYFKERNVNILCLQDTHEIDSDIQTVKEIWGNNCYIHGVKTNSRGVAILFEYKVLEVNKDTQGNYLHLLLKLNSMTLILITVYAPNNDDPAFFNELQNILENYKVDYSVICDDFNLFVNPHKDTHNYKHINNPNACKTVLDMISQFDLFDIYRYPNPNKHRFTWQKRRPLKQARLGFLSNLKHYADLITNCDIKAGYRSEHSLIEMDILLDCFRKHKGVWKFNNSLLSNIKYLDLINKTIQQEVLKYAIPVYDYDFLNNPENNGSITFTVDSDFLLEMIFLQIWGETIKFTSFLKKETNLKEEEFIRDIEKCEKLNITADVHFDVLSDKNLRKYDKLKSKESK